MIGNVELPIDALEEGTLVHINLGDLESRHLAPCLCRIVAILQVLRGKDQRGEEHAPAALEGSHGWRVGHLLSRKVALWHQRHDQDQVVQSYL